MKAPRVLVLDDDKQFRALVRPVLLRRGLEVYEAGTGGEGESLLKKTQVDLIIVDGVLPDVEGLNWITKQRAMGNVTPMMFVSAAWNDIGVYHRLTKNLGVSQVIHKPVIPSVFGEQVMADLGQRPKYRVTEEVFVKSADSVYKEVAVEYIKTLPDNVAAVDKALQKLKMPGDQKQALDDAKTFAHRIRGTAGTFGFQKIGDAMGVIEDVLRRSAADGLSDQEWLVLEEKIQRAKSLIPHSLVSEETLPAHLRTRKITEGHVTLSRLLVVDDDPSILNFLTRMGRQRLVDVVPASDATQALAKLKTTRFDGVILDLQLGADSTSIELAHQIRELPGYSEVPLAFMSAEAGISDRVSIAAAGASLYLNKPIEPDTFEDAVQRLLALNKVGQATVLVVDDDVFFARHAQAVLSEKGLNVQTLEDPYEILDKIAELSPDLLLLDLMMPGLSGFDVCRILRTMPRWQDLPIIFVTTQIGLETRIAAYECGADDYIPKPMADEELVSRVTLRVERAKLLKERTERDTITGLLLRHSFMERFNGLLSSAKRHNHQVGMSLLDIDYFKQVNDNHGHLAGDSVLAGLGRLMTRRFRIEDLRGRWGGDEFILGLYAADRSNALKTTQSLVAEFRKMNFPADDGAIFNATLSAGVSSFPEDGESVYELITAADRRLYAAKARGRDQAVADDDTNEGEVPE